MNKTTSINQPGRDNRSNIHTTQTFGQATSSRRLEKFQSSLLDLKHGIDPIDLGDFRDCLKATRPWE